MKKTTKRSAFSLIELIFVIVILGIVASIGAEMIANVYSQYIIQRGQHRASLKTELAALQIANRLSAAIPGTVVRRDALTGGVIEGINDAMSDSTGDSYIALQWVGADMDSFNATEIPGWSGFCDVDAYPAASTAASISTPGSELNSTRIIINNLSGGTPTPKLYFPYDPNAYETNNITTASTDVIGLTGALPTHIVEHYKLAWSSYALVVKDGDLLLYYNFEPTARINIPDDDATKKKLLMKNISTFRFVGAGRTIRFKICKQENIGEDFNITACKEKAVF